jgi:hypothetical protein
VDDGANDDGMGDGMGDGMARHPNHRHHNSN